ncbi:MAG: peptide chain release factor N(5)-glutamine methyltransferase [Pseudomonadota bacterium]|jgi:release factor glutamine methyltransferase
MDDPVPESAGAAGAWGAQRLGGDSAESQRLLAAVLGQSRGWLLAHETLPLEQAARTRYGEWVARRARGEPLAYITGQKEFWSLPLRITPDVLVPRPETELLVERALALLPAAAPVRVADLGTGSGAIALALARERPHWQVTATDRSPAALEVARGNALTLGLARVRFLQGDWLAPLAGERFDLLASNPPYIGASEPALADPALRHEPIGALCSGPDGLEDLRALIAAAPDHLLPGGWLLLEHGERQGEAVAALFASQGWTRVRCHADLAGRPRVSEARRA